MFAYVKEWKIVAVSETRMRKREDARIEKVFEKRVDEETEEETEVLVDERVVPAIPGLVYDEEIETDLEGELNFVDWKVVKKEIPMQGVMEPTEPEAIPEAVADEPSPERADPEATGVLSLGVEDTPHN